MRDKDYEDEIRESMVLGKVEERLGMDSVCVAATLGFMTFTFILVIFGIADAHNWESQKIILHILGLCLTAVSLGFLAVYLNRALNYDNLKELFS